MFATALFARDHPQITFTANGGWPICAVYLISASCWASSVRLPYRVHIPHYPIRHSSIALKAARQALIQADTPAEWNTRQLRKPFLTDCSTLISIARRRKSSPVWLNAGKFQKRDASIPLVASRREISRHALVYAQP